MIRFLSIVSFWIQYADVSGTFHRIIYPSERAGMNQNERVIQLKIDDDHKWCGMATNNTGREMNGGWGKIWDIEEDCPTFRNHVRLEGKKHTLLVANPNNDLDDLDELDDLDNKFLQEDAQIETTKDGQKMIEITINMLAPEEAQNLESPFEVDSGFRGDTPYDPPFVIYACGETKDLWHGDDPFRSRNSFLFTELETENTTPPAVQT
jgi:hypothetical protein